jgi:hypothetical protein
VCQYQSARVRAFLCASVRKKQKNKKTKPPRVAKTVAKTRAASAPSRARARRDAEKSDLKSSYVDFDPHCASALDFGTIITFRERRRRRWRSDGGEKKKDQKRAGREKTRGKKKRGVAFRFSLFVASLRGLPAHTISPVGSTASETN